MPPAPVEVLVLEMPVAKLVVASLVVNAPVLAPAPTVAPAPLLAVEPPAPSVVKVWVPVAEHAARAQADATATTVTRPSREALMGGYSGYGAAIRRKHTGTYISSPTGTSRG